MEVLNSFIQLDIFMFEIRRTYKIFTGKRILINKQYVVALAYTIKEDHMSTLISSVIKKYNSGQRYVAPLLGFPAVKEAGTSLKLAQQNAGEHMKVIRHIVNKWHPDAVFTLMDLSVEANALGREADFPLWEAATIVNMDYEKDRDLPIIKSVDILKDGRCQSYVETHRMMKKELSPDIIRAAYVSGPYTLAGLIVGAENAAMMTMTETEEFHELCGICLEKILDYTRALLKAGAQMIAVLDPSGMMLGPDTFREFCVDYVKSIGDLCHEYNASMAFHVCGNTQHLLEEMNHAHADALSLDSDVDFPTAAKTVRDDIVLIGNVCPTGAIMSGKPETVTQEAEAMLESMKDVPNFILSTGCDLPIDVPEENVTAFMKVRK